MISFDLDSLLNLESNFFAVNLALSIVDVDESPGFLLGRVNVLLKVTRHLTASLIDAAPSLNVGLLTLLLVLLELYRLLSNQENLLEFHFISIVRCVKLGLHVILYLSLGFRSFICGLETHRGWQYFR